MRVVLDIETEALNNPQVIHCIVCKDIDTGEVKSWINECGHASFKEFIANADYVIGHNIIQFDIPVINRLLGPKTINPSRCVDTLVLSRLWDYRRPGGHSLEAWGETLGFPKGNFNDFAKFSSEMLAYCVNDVQLNHRVYEWLMHPRRLGHPTFEKAIECEGAFAQVCEDMHQNGFGFDQQTSLTLLLSLEKEVADLDEELWKAFPPKSKLIRVVKPKVTKHGTISKSGISNWYEGEDYTVFSEGAEFSLVDWVPFNPGSPRQIIDRLYEVGWDPVDKTEGHKDAIKNREDVSRFEKYGWKINERNISTVPPGAPQAVRQLVKRIMLEARVRTLKEWLACVSTDGRVHGRIQHIGTWTHRSSHKNPNLGNVAAEKSIKYNSPELKERATELGGRMRALWQSTKGSWLVGTDMESAHLRIFAHLIDDKDFIQSLLTGKKEDETDPHSLNKRILGAVCADRDRAKTFIFSFLNGAGVGKVGEIFGCSGVLAKDALDRFVRSYTGLARFKKEVVPRDAKRGFFQGLDGRCVKCDSEHHMLAGYMQNYEAVIMKYANLLWRKELDDLGIKYRQVNFIHDEWQTEVFADLETAGIVGRIQADSIRKIGESFGLRCPMGGTYRIGKNWTETH